MSLVALGAAAAWHALAPIPLPHGDPEGKTAAELCRELFAQLRSSALVPTEWVEAAETKLEAALARELAAGRTAQELATLAELVPAGRAAARSAAG